MEKQQALEAIAAEHAAASQKFPAFNNAHEGYAVILEELYELWDEIKKNVKTSDPEKIRKEAIQVGAMALRFLTDVCRARCRVCGCTDERACVTVEGPCRWIAPDLCSACAVRAVDLTAMKAESVKRAGEK